MLAGGLGVGQTLGSRNYRMSTGPTNQMHGRGPRGGAGSVGVREGRAADGGGGVGEQGPALELSGRKSSPIQCKRAGAGRLRVCQARISFSSARTMSSPHSIAVPFQATMMNPALLWCMMLGLGETKATSDRK